MTRDVHPSDCFTGLFHTFLQPSFIRLPERQKKIARSCQPVSKRLVPIRFVAATVLVWTK